MFHTWCQLIALDICQIRNSLRLQKWFLFTFTIIDHVLLPGIVNNSFNMCSSNCVFTVLENLQWSKTKVVSLKNNTMNLLFFHLGKHVFFFSTVIFIIDFIVVSKLRILFYNCWLAVLM